MDSFEPVRNDLFGYVRLNFLLGSDSNCTLAPLRSN